MVMNVNQLTQDLRMMPDQALQRMAMMYKNDPYVFPMVISEDMTRKKMRMESQAQSYQPQPKVNEQALMAMAQPAPGLAALQAPNIEQMADGGIAGYDDGGMAQQEVTQPGALNFAQHSEPVVRMAEGGEVQRFQSRGAVRSALGPYENLIREEAARQNVDPDLAVRLFTAESGGDPNAVSSKGAVGLGQLMPAAAKEMGLKPEERTDPVKNIRASIGYFAKQLGKYGDPEKAAAAYNWGPANLDKHLEKNEGRLNRVGLPKETADYLTKLVPVSTAQAAPTAKPMTASDALISQIPGQTAAGRTPTPEPTDRTMLDRLFGAGETAASLATGVAAIPLAGISKLGQQLMHGRSDPIQEHLSRFTFAPRGEAGREYSAGLAKIAEDLKIPAYIPAVGPATPGLRTASRMGTAGSEAEAAAAEAAQAAAPRLASTPLSSSRSKTELPRQAAALAEQKTAAESAARRSAAAQQTAAEAAVGKERIGSEAAETGAAGARANVAGVTSAAAQTPPVEPTETAATAPADDGSYDRAEKARLFRQSLPKDTQEDLIKAAKEVAPEGKKEGWTKDDWLTLGFALLSNKSPYFSEALGTAGLKALAGQQERRKEEREDVYRRAMAKKAEAEAGYLTEGTKGATVALTNARQLLADWEKANASLALIDPQRFEMARQAQWEKALRDTFSALGLKLPAGVSSGTAAPAVPQGVTVRQIGG